jgi:hypothetical protein
MRQPTWPHAYPCGCNLDAGYCDVHRSMIATVASVWRDPSTDRAMLSRIWSNTDAYGSPGSVPPQGYDWSGIRDSSPIAIRRMWETAAGLTH